MTKRSQFAIFVDDTLAAIDRHARSGPGRHKQRVPMARELARWALADEEDPVLLNELRFSFLKRSRDFVTGERCRRDLVACAIHAAGRGLTRKRAAALAAVSATDLEAVARVAKAAGLSLESVGRSVSDRVRWAVERHFEAMVVTLDQRAVEDLFLPAIEALAVSKGGKGSSYTETYGLCFGSRRDAERRGQAVRRVFHVNRIVTQLRARATANTVMPHEHSERVHLSLARELFEHLELLGDYHSHPFRSVEKLKANPPGWLPSKDDERQFEEWARGKHEAGHSPRFFLIAAMARGKRTGTRAKCVKRNVVHMVIADVHVYLSAWRSTMDGYRDAEVELRVPGL